MINNSYVKIVRRLNKNFVTKRIKAPFLVYKFFIMYLLLLEGEPSKTTYVPVEKQNSHHCSIQYIWP